MISVPKYRESNEANRYFDQMKIVQEALDQSYREGFEEAVRLASIVCDAQAREWESDSQITDKNYAGFCATLIRNLKVTKCQTH